MAKFKIGDKVIFTNRVFNPPFSPHYDNYAGHVFKITRFHYQNTHIELECISDPSVKVRGYIHPEDIERI